MVAFVGSILVGYVAVALVWGAVSGFRFFESIADAREARGDRDEDMMALVQTNRAQAKRDLALTPVAPVVLAGRSARGF